MARRRRKTYHKKSYSLKSALKKYQRTFRLLRRKRKIFKRGRSRSSKTNILPLI
jgi:hypothetical protein